jgi:hypothetical protein
MSDVIKYNDLFINLCGIQLFYFIWQDKWVFIIFKIKATIIETELISLTSWVLIILNTFELEIVLKYILMIFMMFNIYE